MMTYEEFVKDKELIELIEEVCDVYNYIAIYNTFKRNGIHSIDDLKNTSNEAIRSFRCMGVKRMVFVDKMKNLIEERDL